jgi:5-methylcytosine-specific restriction protein A
LTPAIVVDHVVPLKMGGERFDWANLQSLCASCHNRKSLCERAQQSIGIDAPGLKAH